MVCSYIIPRRKKKEVLVVHLLPLPELVAALFDTGQRSAWARRNIRSRPMRAFTGRAWG